MASLEKPPLSLALSSRLSFYLPGNISKRSFMSEDIPSIISNGEEQMKKAINHLETELVKIRAGKANPQMLDGIVVDYYGSPLPINQVANVSLMDARTLSIQPWEKNMLQPIERAIIAANIGINPQNDGNIIRLFMPALTEERRKELVKRCLAEGEHSKVAIRNIRRDAIEHIKKLQKNGLSEDAAKDAEAGVQQVTDRYITMIEKHLSSKEKEIMAV
jgi:ribosome recycling factor